MTPWEREQLLEQCKRALEYPPTQAGSYQWDSMVVVPPRILLDLLNATEERTMPRRTLSEDSHDE